MGAVIQDDWVCEWRALATLMQGLRDAGLRDAGLVVEDLGVEGDDDEAKAHALFCVRGVAPLPQEGRLWRVRPDVMVHFSRGAEGMAEVSVLSNDAALSARVAGMLEACGAQPQPCAAPACMSSVAGNGMKYEHVALRCLLAGACAALLARWALPVLLPSLAGAALTDACWAAGLMVLMLLGWWLGRSRAA